MTLDRDSAWLNRKVVEEIDVKIAKLEKEGRTEDIAKLERFKRVFFLEPSSNFEVDNNGKITYK